MEFSYPEPEKSVVPLLFFSNQLVSDAYWSVVSDKVAVVAEQLSGSGGVVADSVGWKLSIYTTSEPSKPETS
ncbi:Hypothetical protein VV2_1407 [Vibrio vulnificus CMCP6]|uniref:Uncharacterized protein n=1 Tax=Vibrio vulnificus (strain CMCP6) TaxID=216895 RepID=A0A3Q0L0C4_VIBVU|nr:Hypothetical protein VV2_1407 [Vibrio vulnificus CMCP6]